MRNGKIQSNLIIMIISFCIILFQIFSVCAQAQGTSKTFKISGTGKNGKYVESLLNVVVKQKEFTSEQMKLKMIAEDKKYGNHEYSRQSEPSMIYDCGGTVFYKLFGIGPYWIDANDFAEAILYPFGEHVRPPAGIGALGWGDVRENDVLFYSGMSAHVARVTFVETSLGITTGFWIETKAADESVFSHHIGYSEAEDDPLLIEHGKRSNAPGSMGKGYFDIYHIPDYQSLKIEEVVESDLFKFAGDWFFKDGYGSGYYIWTFNVKGSSGKEISGKTKLTSTDRQDDFVLYDIEALSDGSIKGSWEGNYVNENAVSVPKRGHRIGVFYAKVTPGKTSAEDVIQINCVESDKSQIHPGKDWGWQTATHQKK